MNDDPRGHDDGPDPGAPDGATEPDSPDSATGPAGPVVTGPPRSQHRPRDPLRTTIRVVGELLITAGLVVLLFIGYELWITNIFGHQRQAAATAELDDLWDQQADLVIEEGDSPVIEEGGGTVRATAPGPTLEPGERRWHYDTTEGVGFAKMYIPAFGPDFMFTIVEGTSESALYSGPGHYKTTQYPGQPGNFAMAGHRVNKGAPFDDLGLLDSCDAIVIETRDEWYVYRVLPMSDEVGDWDGDSRAHCDGVAPLGGAYTGVYGREITVPTDGAQLYPVPHSTSMAIPADAKALITLTTCHPKFSDRERMIIHGVLTASYPKTDGFQPPEFQEGM